MALQHTCDCPVPTPMFYVLFGVTNQISFIGLGKRAWQKEVFRKATLLLAKIIPVHLLRIKHVCLLSSCLWLRNFGCARFESYEPRYKKSCS